MVSGITRGAIRLFERKVKAEKKVQMLDLKLKDWLTIMPEEDEAEFVRITQEILEYEDEMFARFVERREKRLRSRVHL